MKRKILIYDDEGAAGVSVLKEEVQKYFRNLSVETVSAENILTENVLTPDVKAFFMPGGAADFYHFKLGEKGKALIRSYVEQGGIYYGICAGAYFAASKAIFEFGFPHLKKISAYGLNLIDAVAVGTLQRELGIKPYEPTAEATAVVTLQDADTSAPYASYYHGGPCFICKKNSRTVVLSHYILPERKAPAIVAEKVKKGLVIASGVHYETSGETLEKRLLLSQSDYKTAQKIAKQLKSCEYRRQQLFQKMMYFARMRES